MNERNQLDVGKTMNDLKKSVKLDDGLEARLQDDTAILTLLSGAVARLKRYFPADTEYFLRKTYALDADSKCLSLDVLTKCGYEETLSRLDNFDEDWWLDNMPRAANTLIIGARFA